MRWILPLLAAVCHLGVSLAIPASLVGDVKASELKQSNKVKRAFDETQSEENQKVPLYYSSPSAIKRGTEQILSDWQQDKDKGQFSDFPVDLFSNDDYEGKSPTTDFNKNYEYDVDKEKLDEALENAILKSELYRGSNPSSQYRYYDDQFEEKKRKRREAKIRLGNRNKRNADLTPEEWLTLLQIWENDRRRTQPDSYRPIWSTYEPSIDLEREHDDNDLEEDDENWLETPVYPHVGRVGGHFSEELSRNGPPYMYEDKRGQWEGFSDNKKKRFVIARDPTRELRYLNGPVKSKNEFYTLSQLLANQREPNAPVHHRLIL